MSRAELARAAGLSSLSARRCDSLIVGVRRAVGAERVRTVRRRGWMLVATESSHGGDHQEPHGEERADTTVA